MFLQCWCPAGCDHLFLFTALLPHKPRIHQPVPDLDKPGCPLLLSPAQLYVLRPQGQVRNHLSIREAAQRPLPTSPFPVPRSCPRAGRSWAQGCRCGVLWAAPAPLSTALCEKGDGVDEPWSLPALSESKGAFSLYLMATEISWKKLGLALGTLQLAVGRRHPPALFGGHSARRAFHVCAKKLLNLGLARTIIKEKTKF